MASANRNTVNNQSSLWLYRSDYDTWERFDAADCTKLNEALASGHHGVILQRTESHVYFVDLLRGRQTNVETGKYRRIQQVTAGCSSWYLLKQQRQYPNGSSNSNNTENIWVPFPTEDAEKMEAALFAGNDFVILDHGEEETYYVDLAKFTFTDLYSNVTYTIKVTNTNEDKDDESDQQETVPVDSFRSKGQHSRTPVEMPEREPISSSLTSTATTATSATASSLWDSTKEGNDDEHEQSEHTLETARVEESQRSLSPVDLKSLLVDDSNDAAENDMWLWRNDYGLWSCYDDELSNLMEVSWARGETGVLLKRGSASYFVDFVEMTQTNIDSGLTRPIQRGW